MAHRPLALTVAALMPVLAVTAFAPASQAATVTCQAIDASSLVAGSPSAPGTSCTGPVQNGDTFEIDFSNVFASNGGSLPINKFYSLQIANLNTGTLNALSFSNVEFLVTGTTGSGSFSDTPILVWTQATPTFPFAQGLSGYSTSGNTGSFGGNPVASQASFTLASPLAPTALGKAGVINTIPVQLSSAGVLSFTGAKIRGTFNGSTDSFRGFSAGLALFNSFPTNTPPDVIYGNAFNVPGPLPLLGAGAAFGWSRRLRRRVRQAATPVT